MLNQSVLVGRLTSDVVVRETETGKHISTITLAVPRSYKNESGEYETDFIDIVLWNSIAEKTAEYCRKGDMLGQFAVLRRSNAKILQSDYSCISWTAKAAASFCRWMRGVQWERIPWHFGFSHGCCE